MMNVANHVLCNRLHRLAAERHSDLREVDPDKYSTDKKVTEETIAKYSARCV